MSVFFHLTWTSFSFFGFVSAVLYMQFCSCWNRAPNRAKVYYSIDWFPACDWLALVCNSWLDSLFFAWKTSFPAHRLDSLGCILSFMPSSWVLQFFKRLPAVSSFIYWAQCMYFSSALVPHAMQILSSHWYIYWLCIMWVIIWQFPRQQEIPTHDWNH